MREEYFTGEKWETEYTNFMVITGLQKEQSNTRAHKDTTFDNESNDGHQIYFFLHFQVHLYFYTQLSIYQAVVLLFVLLIVIYRILCC